VVTLVGACITCGKRGHALDMGVVALGKGLVVLKKGVICVRDMCGYLPLRGDGCHLRVNPVLLQIVSQRAWPLWKTPVKFSSR